jgi:FAD:protein FMN transferase
MSAPDLVAARRALELELEAIDRACSRFRDDSEVMRLRRSGAHPVAVSETLCEAIAVALRVAAMTDGLVDPTVGEAMVELGYDRDFAELCDEPSERVPHPRPAPGWRSVELDEVARTVRMPDGVLLDLGASAKALVVDKAVASAAAQCAGGVLVNVGGDLAVAGPSPADGWSVLVADSHRAPSDGPGQRIAVHDGALATSSTTVRRWTQAGTVRHHIVDPATGAPAPETWRTVSVAASSCVDANAASTASILKGEAAPGWLAECKLPARLVRPDGRVLTVADWPRDVENDDAGDTRADTDSGADGRAR